MESATWKKSALIPSCGSGEKTWVKEERKKNSHLARAGFSEEAEWGTRKGRAISVTAVERELGANRKPARFSGSHTESAPCCGKH